MSDSRPGDIFQPGDLLNNTYRIQSMLGRGGTSEVYQARSEISGRVVALKALKSEFSMNEDYLVLMTREEDIRDIQHDAVVRYYDNQRTPDGHVYLVMDYVDGPGLDEMLKSGGMPAADLLTVGARVAEGLVAAHSKNIVHRDLSPDNIILRNGKPEEAVIIDFGIAKDTNPGAETIVGNEFAGKYAYAAPEQLSGQTDARTDIYSLGALLLAVFRGKKPDIGNNPMEVVKKKSEALDTEGVPEPLKALIDRMTHPIPDQRFQGAKAVLNAFRAPGSTGETETRSDEASDATVIAPPPRTPTRPEAKRKKGSTGLILAAVFVLLAAVGGGGYFAGFFDGLLGPRYPVADPYSLVVEKRPGAQATAVGNVPSEESLAALSAVLESDGGSVDLTLATGEISETWGADVVSLAEQVARLDEYRLLVSGDTFRATGLTANKALRRTVIGLLESAPPGAFTGTADIILGPRLLSLDALEPLLARFADCGPLELVDPPAIGYGMGSRVMVTGRFAETGSRVGLFDAISEISGDRQVEIDAEVLDPSLCLIEATLPKAPPGGFSITFGFGDRPDPNPSGRYFVGENPVIDVTIPAEITDGFLWVSVLDVSGNVFHLLPNLNRPENAIEALREGSVGPHSVRVAYPLSEAADSSRLAFLVDDSSLGKSKILALYARGQIFDGIRPTTESAASYAEALQKATANGELQVQSLDTRVLTTATP